MHFNRQKDTRAYTQTHAHTNAIVANHCLIIAIDIFIDFIFPLQKNGAESSNTSKHSSSGRRSSSEQHLRGRRLERKHGAAEKETASLPEAATLGRGLSGAG